MNETVQGGLGPRVEIKIGRGAIEPKALLMALNLMEKAVYDVDRRRIAESARAMPELPTIVVDASLERLRSFKDRRLRLVGARTGSIEIIAEIQ